MSRVAQQKFLGNNRTSWSKHKSFMVGGGQTKSWIECFNVECFLPDQLVWNGTSFSHQFLRLWAVWLLAQLSRCVQSMYLTGCDGSEFFTSSKCNRLCFTPSVSSCTNKELQPHFQQAGSVQSHIIIISFAFPLVKAVDFSGRTTSFHWVTPPPRYLAHWSALMESNFQKCCTIMTFSFSATITYTPIHLKGMQS